MHDEQIVAQFQNGDRSKFDELIDRYQTTVFRTCFRYLGHKQDAEDTAQEVFVKAYQALHRFQPNAKFSTWLYRITVNHCINELRSRKRRAIIHSVNPFGNYQVEAKSAVLDEANRPDNVREREERAEIVRHAIAALPEKQRTALILSRYEGLSYKEIAQVMGTSIASVESRLHRAKTKLYQQLKSIFK